MRKGIEPSIITVIIFDIGKLLSFLIIECCPKPPFIPTAPFIPDRRVEMKLFYSNLVQHSYAYNLWIWEKMFPFLSLVHCLIVAVWRASCKLLHAPLLRSISALTSCNLWAERERYTIQLLIVGKTATTNDLFQPCLGAGTKRTIIYQ